MIAVVPTPMLDVARRLAAVLSADAKGYSRLMGEDEIGTVRTLTAHRALITEAVQRYQGRVVDSPGDNVLAEFASIVAAVECAVDIQRALADRNARLAAHRRLDFRIGINDGDVIVDGDRIYGETVNVAARIEALADAGSVCVTASVYEHVATKVPILWQSLGEQAVKNIPRPVRVFRALLDTTRSAPPSVRVESDRPSIAVLPFREIGLGDENQGFGDSLVEALVAALSSLPELFVLSATSTARFRGRREDLASLGRELGVRYVLTGSVRRAGPRLRISEELADVASQGVLWADKVDGQVDTPFELLDRLSLKTVTTVAPHVREAQIHRALGRRPAAPDACDVLLRELELVSSVPRSEIDAPVGLAMLSRGR